MDQGVKDPHALANDQGGGDELMIECGVGRDAGGRIGVCAGKLCFETAHRQRQWFGLKSRVERRECGGGLSGADRHSADDRGRFAVPGWARTPSWDLAGLEPHPGQETDGSV